MGLNIKTAKAKAFAIISSLPIAVISIVSFTAPAFAISTPSVCTSNVNADYLSNAKTAIPIYGMTYDWTNGTNGAVLTQNFAGIPYVRLTLASAGLTLVAKDGGSNITKFYLTNTTGSTVSYYQVQWSLITGAISSVQQNNVAAGASVQAVSAQATPNYATGTDYCYFAAKNITYDTGYTPTTIGTTWPYANGFVWPNTTYASAPGGGGTGGNVVVTNTPLAITDSKNCIDNVCKFEQVQSELSTRDMKIVAAIIVAFVSYQLIKPFKWRSV